MTEMKEIEKKVRDVEALITFDIGGRGIIKLLYESALSIQGEYPTLLAARKVRERLSEGRCAMITTGFFVSPGFIQETDGPNGAISLARGFEQFCGANSIIVAEKGAQSILRAVAYASGLNVVRPEDIEKAKHAITLLDFPVERETAEEKAREIIEEYNPAIMVAIEKAGANEAKVYHNLKGDDISRHHAKVEVLLEEAKKRATPSIGIGDGGNEVGMGKIKETVKKVVPYGSKCSCECGKGIAADFESDILVAATVSNWGANAIIAALSLLTERTLLHSPQLENKMLLEAAREGALDGIKWYVNGGCDGMSMATHSSIVQIMREIIER